MVCKIILCSEFPDILVKTGRVTRRRRAQAVAKRVTFHANTINSNKYKSQKGKRNISPSLSYLHVLMKINSADARKFCYQKNILPIKFCRLKKYFCNKERMTKNTFTNVITYFAVFSSDTFVLSLASNFHIGDCIESLRKGSTTSLKFQSNRLSISQLHVVNPSE